MVVACGTSFEVYDGGGDGVLRDAMVEDDNSGVRGGFQLWTFREIR